MLLRPASPASASSRHARRGGEAVLLAALPITLLLLALMPAQPVYAAETDQYLTWDIELADSAPALNQFLNEQLQTFIRKTNHGSRKYKTKEDLAQAYYLYLFQGLQSSRVRAFLTHSKDVEKYPPKDVSFWKYQRMGILRGFSFPYILPMERTIRVGDVYLGIDKVSHFFGFGRRYYERYLKIRPACQSDEEAERRIIHLGIVQELGLVGKLVDGIFAHADVEANWQGYLMLRDLAQADPPYFVKEGKDWRIAREIDIVPYITPDMDESYNTCHYWSFRKRNVLRILKAEYCCKRNDPIVKARFERYGTYPHSFSQQVVKEFFDRGGHNPQTEQSLDVICNGINCTK